VSAGLKRREDDPLAEPLEQAEAEIGHLTMELELYRKKSATEDAMSQVRALRGKVSPGTGRSYPLDLILSVHDVARSTFYDARKPAVEGPSQWPFGDLGV
jgi:hypothetical protein